MSDKIFDLEQQIMNAWNVVDDIEMLYKAVGDSEEFADLEGEQLDKIMNVLLGLSSLYALKFETCFKTFEGVCKEYHANRIKAEDLEERLAKQIDWEHRKQTR